MLAARYRGQVRYYEFWNEPNGYSWNKVNAPEEYAPILRIAYTALKEGNPDCVVAIGGLDGSGWKGYTEYLERLYDLGCGDYFDAVAVHPYRVDGPIDTHSLKRIHQILVRHGHGDRKLWLTEYGWPKDYGHDNKARWLEQTLDILTSPEYDFIFQASYHTLADFNTAEYGLCDAELHPRAAYQVYRDYPKDWNEIVERRKTPTPTPRVTLVEGFETPTREWVPFGDGFTVINAKEIGIPSEEGEKVLASGSDTGYESGGAYLLTAVPRDIPVRLCARVLTDHAGGSRGFCRVGVDPTGATEPKSESVIWGRSLETWNAWDSAAVGQGDPIYPKSDRVTLFLQYEQRGGERRTPRVFDQVEFVAREDTFELPKVQPVATPTMTPALRTILKVDFEHFRVVDWGIGHDVWLPLCDPGDPSTFMKPRNDGGDWAPFHWEQSNESRTGKSCLEIRLQGHLGAIRGCGGDWWFHGESALPPDRDILVSVWTNCTRKHESEYTNIILGWQPGDYEGYMGGIQEYVTPSLRERESGWALQTLRFRSHPDPEVGNIIGLGFAAQTTEQKSLSAFFDDLTISVVEE